MTTELHLIMNNTYLYLTTLTNTPLMSGSMLTAFTPYGYSRTDARSTIGFNGELREAFNQNYNLGSYRQFNPILMRFHSCDSWSPFGRGGINGYAYTSRPYDFTDPTGHAIVPTSNQWSDLLFGNKPIQLTGQVKDKLMTTAGTKGFKQAFIDTYDAVVGIEKKTKAQLDLAIKNQQEDDWIGTSVKTTESRRSGGSTRQTIATPKDQKPTWQNQDWHIQKVRELKEQVNMIRADRKGLAEVSKRAAEMHPKLLED